MNQAFEAWFQGGANKQKLERVNGGYKLSSAHLSWIAWQAASQHYEAKLAEMQAELNQAKLFLIESREDVRNALRECEMHTEYAHNIESIKNKLDRIDAFLAKDK